jgi:hypothetical protein
MHKRNLYKTGWKALHTRVTPTCASSKETRQMDFVSMYTMKCVVIV